MTREEQKADVLAYHVKYPMASYVEIATYFNRAHSYIGELLFEAKQDQALKGKVIDKVEWVDNGYMTLFFSDGTKLHVKAIYCDGGRLEVKLK